MSETYPKIDTSPKEWKETTIQEVPSKREDSKQGIKIIGWWPEKHYLKESK